MSKAYHNIGQALSSNFHADCLKLGAAALMCNLQHITTSSTEATTVWICKQVRNLGSQTRVSMSASNQGQQSFQHPQIYTL